MSVLCLWCSSWARPQARTHIRSSPAQSPHKRDSANSPPGWLRHQGASFLRAEGGVGCRETVYKQCQPLGLHCRHFCFLPSTYDDYIYVYVGWREKQQHIGKTYIRESIRSKVKVSRFDPKPPTNYFGFCGSLVWCQVADLFTSREQC